MSPSKNNSKVKFHFHTRDLNPIPYKSDTSKGLQTYPNFFGSIKLEKESSNHCKKEIEEKKVNLNKKEAIYLWNSLGEILTKSLLDVAKRQPENPIHSLAHSLIYYKYHKKSKDTPNIAEGLVPRTEAVFKTIKTPQVEQQKTTSVDEDQEILPFTTNIVQQIMFNLFEQ